MSAYTEEDIERIAELGKPTPHSVFAGIRRFRKDKVHFIYHVRPKRLAEDEAIAVRKGWREPNTIRRRINLKFETVLRRAMLAERRAA